MAADQYFLPTKIIFGTGSLAKLAETAASFSPKKILLVAGEHLKKDGTVKKLTSQLKKVLVYNQPILGSNVESINRLLVYCRRHQPDLVIAIGGGTILDTAKAAAILAPHPGSIGDYVITKTQQITKPSVSLIAIPTTAGTGSEVTPWAVVWDKKNKKKYSLASPLMFPKIALVDSRLTQNLPPEITALTGLDALTQAIEAFWSKNHNPVSDILALQSIKLIFKFLPKAVKNPDPEVREKMAQASLFSGLAFSNTKTTICHSVSYPLTSHFQIPHGQAVALTLAPFLTYSFKVIEKKRGRALLEAIGESGVTKATQKIESLIKKVGCKIRLSALGIKKEAITLIVKEGFTPERAGNAPRVPTRQELRRILTRIY
jgi:alcohol dehydrogenase